MGRPQIHLVDLGMREVAFGFAVVLVACAVRHYGYTLAPPEWRAQAWNVTGAVLMLALPAMAAWRWPSPAVWLIAAWWAVEESMVIGCTVTYLLYPWPVPVGEDQCSSLLQFDLGQAGALLMAMSAWRLVILRRRRYL